MAMDSSQYLGMHIQVENHSPNAPCVVHVPTKLGRGLWGNVDEHTIHGVSEEEMIWLVVNVASHKKSLSIRSHHPSLLVWLKMKKC